MSFKLYDILGVPRSATIDEIKQAYRKRAVSEHPDKGGDPEKFKELTAAYSILSDPHEKQKYDDQFGTNPQNFNDIFSQMFNFSFGGVGTQHPPTKQRDFVYTLTITQKDAFFGLTKNIKIHLKKVCFQCVSKCSTCNGTGQISETTQNHFFTQIYQKQCPTCHGKKQVNNLHQKECTGCQGKGETVEEIVICVNIPAGIVDGYKILYNGMGEQQKSHDEINGDFIVLVNIAPDSVFLRRGNDFVHRVSITFIESIIGKKIFIPHYSEEIEVDTEEFTIIKPDKEYIIPHKGMSIQGSSNFGDLIIVFDINYSLSPESKKRIKNLLWLAAQQMDLK
jgi:DnaJ-class molecular chaperone